MFNLLNGKGAQIMTKVIIIGGGVVGCAVARELARYQCEVLLFERNIDVSEGTSKANSGIIHAGFDAKPNTHKAKFNVIGNEMFDSLSKELDFSFFRNGAMVLCFSEEELPALQKLQRQGLQNGVKGLEIISGQQALQIEPKLSKEVVYALYAPTSGIVSPYEMTLAYAENAHDNGVRFEFGAKVTNVTKVAEEGYCVSTETCDYYCDVVVNCAGVYADDINDMVNESPQFTIVPRKGEYILLDKECEEIVQHTIFRLPTNMGKGVLVTRTIHGTVLVGPTSVDITDKEDVNPTPEGLESLWEKGILLVPTLNREQEITQFAGNRAHGSTGDFVIGWAQKGFFNLSAIESPGLTSAPALAVYASEEIAKEYGLQKNPDFNPIRKDIPHLFSMTEEEKRTLIATDPAYGNIVCRCESVTEGEIRDSIRRPIGAKSLDGIKRRTRAGMGRCQNCYCGEKVLQILSRELNVNIEEIPK